MSYQIALLQTALNRNYENVIRFDTREQQASFFGLDTLFKNAPTLNLLKGDFYNLEIPYKIPGVTLRDMESYNYCIIKETIGTTTRYYYYFITNLRYDSSNQFILSLEMDIFNTYYIGAVFSDGLIQRAHVNRFNLLLDDNDDPAGAIFNNDPDSPMLIPDMPTDLSKYCYGRYPVRKKWFGNDTIDNWIFNNVEGWLYVFLQRGHQYKFYKSDGSYNIEIPQALFIDEELITGGTSVSQSFDNYYTYICMPIYKTSKRIIYNLEISPGMSVKYTFHTDAENYFKIDNSDTTYYIARVISQVPPKNILDTTGGFVVDANGDLVLACPPQLGYTLESNVYGAKFMAGRFVTTHTSAQTLAVFTPFTVDNSTLSITNTLYPSPTTVGATVPNLGSLYQSQFTFNDFLNADFDKKFNPKLQGSVYKELQLRNNDGKSFTYDMQKMDNDEVMLLYTEKPQPGVTRTYTRLSSYNNNYGVYTPTTSENLTGLVVSQDCNLSYTNDQLASYLAQNRNAQTQITAKGLADLGKSLIGFITGTASMAILGGSKGAGSSGASGIGGVINTGIDWGMTQYNFDKTKDNMKYAPDDIRIANGDVIFNMCCTEFNVFVELYTAIEQEIDREAERMNLFGFKLNRLGNIKNVDNIRKYFNFVQGDVESMLYVDENNTTHSLPNIIVNKFKSVFNSGVRFWNYTGGKFLDYTKENYENWLIPYVEVEDEQI